MQLQLQLQLQLHCATLHHTTSSTCGWGDHCNHLKKVHNSNHPSVHQWVRSAIHASQQLTSPIVSYLWNFRHRLVRYYWYWWDINKDKYYIYVYIMAYNSPTIVNPFPIELNTSSETMVNVG